MAKMVFCNKCGRQFGKIDNLNGFHYAGKLGYGSCHQNPITKGDMVYCKSFSRDGQYFTMTSYDKI